MKKIPSLFQRNYDTDRLCRPEIVEGCEWVIEEADQVTVSRKWDGAACLVRDGRLFRRYDRKKHRKTGELKEAPEGWQPCEEAPNEHTGHWPGWVPVRHGQPQDGWHLVAASSVSDGYVVAQGGQVWGICLPDGTYELCGPRINGNPEGFTVHQFVPHGAHQLGRWMGFVREQMREMREKQWSLHHRAAVLHDLCGAQLRWYAMEGLVFQHADGRRAKVKARDFGIAWPVKP